MITSSLQWHYQVCRLVTYWFPATLSSLQAGDLLAPCSTIRPVGWFPASVPGLHADFLVPGSMTSSAGQFPSFRQTGDYWFPAAFTWSAGWFSGSLQYDLVCRLVITDSLQHYQVCRLVITDSLQYYKVYRLVIVGSVQHLYQVCRLILWFPAVLPATLLGLQAGDYWFPATLPGLQAGSL